MKKYTFAMLLCVYTTASAAEEFVFVPGTATHTSYMSFNGVTKTADDTGDRTLFTIEGIRTANEENRTLDVWSTIANPLTHGDTPSEPLIATHIVKHGSNRDVVVEYEGKTADIRGATTITLAPKTDVYLEAGCTLPESFTTTGTYGTEILTYSYNVITKLMTRSLPQEEMELGTTCSGQYRRYRPINLSVHPSNIKLTGTTMEQLTSTSEITLMGSTSNVLVEIANPNTSELTVSFSQTAEDLNTIIPLASEQDIQRRTLYVSAKPTVPGHKEYRVNINASYI